VEAIKIVGMCIVAAIIYGIIHDQFTARICIQYFTEFHPPVFPTTSPTLLAFGWGVIATWWAGAIIGLLLLIASRYGSLPPFPAEHLLPLVAKLMAMMALCAVTAGLIGYFFAPIPGELAQTLGPAFQRRFLADWWAHGASYASGPIGGLVLCGIVWRRRARSIHISEA
jgi:hypothetical protein